MRTLFQFAAYLLTALFLLLPVRAAEQQHGARTGTVNYVEGTVTLGSQSLNANSIGQSEVDPGQTLSTQNGKAEFLLTPGIFGRLGESSAATMISSALTNTRLSIDRGEAFVEVAEIHPENVLRIVQDGVTTELLKMGLYNFNAKLHVIRVLVGEALVQDGERPVRVKSGQMIDLSAEPLRAEKFDRPEVEAEDLYRWTSLRSAYLAEANADYAPKYMFGGFGWFGDGWYWDTWFDAYTFLPADGIFYSPFGWGFYSPWCAFGAPFSWGSHYHHHFSPNHQGWGSEAHYTLPANYGHGVHYASGYRAHNSFGGARNGGFHSSGLHTGSGFHGIGGGFHGGGGHSGGGGGHH
jgi:uncharacterized membrane protein YgcG